MTPSLLALPTVYPHPNLGGILVHVLPTSSDAQAPCKDHGYIIARAIFYHSVEVFLGYFKSHLAMCTVFTLLWFIETLIWRSLGDELAITWSL